MPKQRSNTQIIADTLISAKTPSSQARLNRLSNLSSKLFQKYLSSAVEDGLLDFDGNMYRTSIRGLQYLRKYGELIEMAPKSLSGSSSDMKYWERNQAH